MKAFSSDADFLVRFHPYQIFPQLERKPGPGVEKMPFYEDLAAKRRPDETASDRAIKRSALEDCWQKENLHLAPGGRVGNSFDAQRLIWFGRLCGKENEMVESVMLAHHTDGKCLTDPGVLLDIAECAGFARDEATTFLNSQRGCADVASKTLSYFNSGITATPVIVFDNRFPFYGAPDVADLKNGVEQLLETGEIDPPVPSRNNSANFP